MIRETNAKMILGSRGLAPKRNRCWPLSGKRQSGSIGQWRTDKYVFAGMGYVFTDRQTAPMHTGAIQGNCLKVTSLRKR